MPAEVEFFPVIVARPQGKPGEVPRVDPVRVRVASAGAVAAGDLVVGFAPTVRAAVGRPLMVMGYQEPYTARPRPFAPGCGCDGCGVLPAPHGPLSVVLCAAGDEGSRWDECESYAAAEPVLVVPSAGW